MSLAEELAARMEQGRASPDAELSGVCQSRRGARKSGVTERAVGVADRAPMFDLPDAFGNHFDLTDQLAGSRAIMAFYRGAWCPFGYLGLRALQRGLNQVG